MRRLIVLLATAAAVIGLATPAHAGNIERHRYVANDFGSFVLASLSQSTGIAMDGTVLFKAQSDHIVLTVADRVAKGTVPVIIDTTDGHRVQCLRVGHATRIAGFVAGEWAGLTLLDATYHSSCSMGATAGMLTISR